MECADATEFRRRAILKIGAEPYRKLLHACHIYPQGDDLVLRTPSPTLRDLLRAKTELARIARELGFEYRVIVGEVHHLRAPDPKVADAARQPEAIRGGRAAGVAAQAGGWR